MTIDDLVALAELGRERVIEHAARNVISWLGELPSTADIRAMGKALEKAHPYGVEV